MIQVDNISVDFEVDAGKRRRVLRGISLTIAEGESIAIMGPNGSGKSTLAACLNGLLWPSEGQVFVDNLRTDQSKNLKEIRRRVGMVFQNPDNQIVSASVEREIAFGLENLCVPHDEMHQTVDKMLKQFDLEKYRRQSPHYLSGGEKQKLAIASVLAMQPRYLILDEPTSLLDPRSRNEILAIVRHLNQSSNGISPTAMTTILITQFPAEALRANRLIIINHGEIVMDGKPEELFTHVDEFHEMGLEVPIKFKLDHLLRQHHIYPVAP